MTRILVLDSLKQHLLAYVAAALFGATALVSTREQTRFRFPCQLSTGFAFTLAVICLLALHGINTAVSLLPLGAYLVWLSCRFPAFIIGEVKFRRSPESQDPKYKMMGFIPCLYVAATLLWSAGTFGMFLARGKLAYPPMEVLMFIVPVTSILLIAAPLILRARQPVPPQSH